MNLKNETFAPLKDYEGVYEISNLGRVRSLPRLSMDGRPLEGRLLKQTYNPKNNYKRVRLTAFGKSKVEKVHQLMAFTFLDHVRCGHKLVVDHIDGNKLNNSLDNLRIVTNRENTLIKGVSKFRGVSFNAKLQKWKAQILLNGKQIFLGYYLTEDEAAKAYKTALHLHKNKRQVKREKIKSYIKATKPLPKPLPPPPAQYHLKKP